MEQTAVEWLFNQMSNVAAGYITELSEQEILNKAKEIEQKQIVQAFNHGRNVGSVGSPGVDGNYYYKQIFESKDDSI